MKHATTTRAIFAVAAAYDAVLGVAFLGFGPQLFDHFQIVHPNHWAYIQFPAAVLVIFALMFAAVAVAPQRNRNLIPYGILLKAAYASVVAYHWITADLAFVWKPLAAADAVFALTFIYAYLTLKPANTRANTA